MDKWFIYAVHMAKELDMMQSIKKFAKALRARDALIFMLQEHTS